MFRVVVDLRRCHSHIVRLVLQCKTLTINFMINNGGRCSGASCWEKGPTNLGIEESVTAFSRDSDPVMVSLGFALDA